MTFLMLASTNASCVKRKLPVIPELVLVMRAPAPLGESGAHLIQCLAEK